MQTDHSTHHESTDSNPPSPDDISLDGVAVDGAAMNIKNVEDGARVVVETISPVEADEDVVALSIRGDTISGRVFLDSASAAEVANRLATAADEAVLDK